MPMTRPRLHMRFRLLLPLLLLPAACAPADAAGTAWYVDFDHGDDNASGRTAATAFRHAPGDAAASGTAAGVRLSPGESVLFKGGVAYRGTIKAMASTEPGRPIRYVGDEWGTTRAIFSGADPVSAMAPCPSQEACGNNPGWRNMMVIRYATDSKLVKFYTADAMLYVSQYPQPRDPFFADETDGYASVDGGAIPGFMGGSVEAGRAVRAMGTATADSQIAFWASPNEVVARPVTVAGDTLRFPVEGVKMYDKAGLYSVLNAPGLITGPGQFATLPGGTTALAWIRPQPLFVGTRRSGFEVSRVSNIVIKGFSFRNFTAAEGDVGVGAAIISRSKPLANIVITGNDFIDMAMHNKAGPIQLSSVTGLKITGNRFENLERGSAVRLAGITDAEISGNVIRNIGRTGIAFFGNASSKLRITDNVITGLFGTHGNGISIYRDNRDVLVANNTVVNSAFPLTFHGAFDPATPNNLTITRNLLQSVGDKHYAAVSWGKKLNGLVFNGNIVIAAGPAMVVNFDDTNVAITNNVLSATGFTYEKVPGQAPPPEWKMAGNRIGTVDGTAIVGDPARLPDPAFGTRKPAYLPLPEALCRTLAPALDAGRRVGATHICR